MSSSRCFGSGALAEYAVTGSSPIATATGIRPSSAARRSARPSLCICQCMKVERAVDHLHPVHADVADARLRVLRDDGRQRDERRGVARPAALDRQSPEVDVVALEKTSWHGAFETVFGSESATDFSFRRPLHLLASPSGGCMSRMSPSLAAASSSFSTPSARHMRRSVPNWLMRSGCCEPFGFSKRSAGPPDLTTRSVISVISRSGSTSAEMRRSSPSRSRSAIHSRRSRGGARRESVYGAVSRREFGIVERAPASSRVMAAHVSTPIHAPRVSRAPPRFAQRRVVHSRSNESSATWSSSRSFVGVAASSAARSSRSRGFDARDRLARPRAVPASGNLDTVIGPSASLKRTRASTPRPRTAVLSRASGASTAPSTDALPVGLRPIASARRARRARSNSPSASATSARLRRAFLATAGVMTPTPAQCLRRVLRRPRRDRLSQ